LYITITGLTTNNATGFIIEPNSDVDTCQLVRVTPAATPISRTALQMGVNTITASPDNVAMALTIENYTLTSIAKTVNYYGTQNGSESNIISGIYFNTSAAVTSIKFKVSNPANNFTAGTVKIYGVK
jgi:hypothetical protein